VPAARATQDQFEGCLLGLALGDALGAPFEGGPIERFVWRLLGTTRAGEMRWTDDTQMSLDLAESLIDNGAVAPDELAPRFARSYRWSRGYGGGAAKLLKRIARGHDWRDANRAVFPDGSFGNGAAMRAPMIGLFYAARPEERAIAARDSARVTHAHPLGMEATVLIAAATASAIAQNDAAAVFAGAAMCVEAPPYRTRFETAHTWLEQDERPDAGAVAQQLGNGVAAIDSCVTAIYLAARFLGEPFLDLQQFVTACGGDTDTIGAMSGAIWGAANGAAALPEKDLARLEQRKRLQTVAQALHAASG